MIAQININVKLSILGKQTGNDVDFVMCMGLNSDQLPFPQEKH
jgi:hypothetical protein